jgi:hypothetical protein
LFGKQYLLRIHGPNEDEEATLRSNRPFGAIKVGDKIDLRSFREQGFKLDDAYMGVVAEVVHSFGRGQAGDSLHTISIYTSALPGVFDARKARK